MAQKHLPILNRVGIFQPWSNSWDGKKTYSIRHRQQLFFTFILQEFVEHRNSVSIYLFDQAELDEQLKQVEKLPKEPTFAKLVEAVRLHRIKRYRHIYMGQITMLRFQAWTVFLLFVYKPRTRARRKFVAPREFLAVPKIFVDTQMTYLPSLEYKSLF